VNLFRDLSRRLRQSHRWVVLQFVGTALLILVGILWTRLPEKHIWQVALSLLLPLLLAASALALQAGTVRALADDDGKRVLLAWGAISLLFWIVVAWVAWALLDSCDERIWNWASYLNSQAPAHLRARLLTYEHIGNGLRGLEWILRWIVVPAKVIPFAAASAQWGYKLPWRRVLRLLWNWQWWLGVVLISLLAVWLPGWFFTGIPHGAVSAQVGRVGLKLFTSYLLGVGGWVLLLGWGSALFSALGPLPERDGLTELFHRLRLSRRWVAAQFVWLALFIATNRAIANFLSGDSGLQAGLSIAVGTVLFIAGLAILAGISRSQLSDQTKPVRFIWGALLLVVWIVVGLVIAFSLSLWYTPIAPLVVGWIVTPALLLPFAVTSAVWGTRLPWKRVLRVMLNWRWWLGVLIAALAIVLSHLLDTAVVVSQAWVAELKMGIANLLQLGVWILLLGWLAVLFARTISPPDKTLAEIPALKGPSEPSQKSSVKLPLPEDN